MIAPRLTSLLLAAAAASSAACHRQPVLTTPASDQVPYAARYPERLREVRSRFAADEEKARKSFDALRALPATVPASNADELEQIVRHADAGGRSQPYVDEALRQEDIDALMSENRSAIRRRVAGSVAFAAKEKECVKEDIDALAGTAATATDRAVDRQLEERLRSHNPAHRYLRAHVDELGQNRADALERPIDALTRASFVAGVRLPLYRIELEELIDSEKAVRTTLERDEAEGRTTLDRQDLTKSHRLAIEEQVARDEAARLAIPNEVTASKAAQEDLELRAEALQRDYQTLIDGLLAELTQKQASAPASPNKPEKADTKPAASAGAPSDNPDETQPEAPKPEEDKPDPKTEMGPPVPPSAPPPSSEPTPAPAPKR